MTPRTRCTALTALIICMALPASGQQYLLYSPQPVASDQKASSQDGILVREIQIQKGDTLYKLSRKFSGRGMYYPQILLFNSIKNPDLIFTGNTLRVPITQKEAQDSEPIGIKPPDAAQKPKSSRGKRSPRAAAAQSPTRQQTAASPASAPSTELSLSDLKTVGADRQRTTRLKRKSTVQEKRTPAQELPGAQPATLPQPLPAANTSAAVPPPVGDANAGQKLFETAVKAYRQDDCRTALELLDRYLADNSGSPLAADANLYKAECYLKLSAQ